MTTRGYKSFWSAAICLIFLSSIAGAAYRDTTESQATTPSDQYNQSMSQSQTMATESSKGIHGRAGTLQSADKAIGMSVHNNQGDKIGTIKDLVVDKNTNAVSYVILSSGMKYYPVPWSAFRSGDRAYTLDVTKDGLRDAPTIKSDDPKLLTGDITQKVQSFYSSQISSSKEFSAKTATSMTKAAQDMSMGTTPNFYSCRKTLGMDVKNDQDKKIADLKDIVFDVRQGNLAYGLVSFGGVMGVAAKTAAVPWSAIQIQPDQKIARLNADERTLTSAEIGRDQFAKLNDPTFARQIHQDFGQEPYWEVYGYVPPTAEEGAMTTMRHGAGAAGMFATGAWATDSSYNKSFKTDAVTTAEGTVKSVDTFTPETGASPGLKLKIETTNKETETVQLGPQSWMDSQNIKFNEGDRITVTGSKVRHGLSKVIMASEIKKGDQTLRLRDEQGRPMWTSEMNRSGMSMEPNKPDTGTPPAPSTPPGGAGSTGTNY